MKYRVLLIDDDPIVLADQCEKWKDDHRVLVVGAFNSIHEARRFLRGRSKVDIILCDIEMPDMSGLEGVELLQNKCNLLVFVTGYPDYAFEAYRKNVDMYVMKPLTTKDVFRIVSKLENRLGYSSLASGFTESFLIRTPKGSLVNVSIYDITKLCTNGHYVDVYATDLVGIAAVSLTEAMEFLEPTDLFVRVGQSTVVSLNFIARYSEGYLYVKDGNKFLLGRTYGPAVRDFLDRHQLKRRVHV